MGEIVILDENTANKIAAGEVIERPASVVKELVENSIDAGADSISIEIKNGGISYIKITDNGSGIREDDAVIAFERHATSKIRSADDLEHVLTMGFRGEALASIAAVADVQVTTRVKDSEYGTFVEIRGGHTIDVRQIGCPVGTTIVIRDLFFNTPARFKFLKKDSTEAGYISEAISRIAMGNPGISFKYVAGGSQVLYTPGNNDQVSAIFSIYGKETAKNVFEINYTDEKIKIYGYAGKPEIARSNRSHQYVYINRRFIKSKVIIAAVDEAYNTFLMKNKFPFILLNIGINPMMVDVNVHPTKMEVKFSNEQEIFKAVYHAVNNALLASSEIRHAVLAEKPAYNPFKMESKEKPDEIFTQQSIQFSRRLKEESLRKPDIPIQAGYTGKEDYNECIHDKSDDEYSTKRAENANVKYGKCNQTEKLALEADVHTVERIETKPITKADTTAGTELTVEQEPEIIKESEVKPEPAVKPESAGSPEVIVKPGSMERTETALHIEQTVEAEPYTIDRNAGDLKPKSEKTAVFGNARIIGQIFSTYIILEQEGQMLLIDQHAAHERIMYEELKSRFENLEPMSQMLLDTIVIELTHQELKLLEEEKAVFNRLGFEYDYFGSNSIILRAVPFSSMGQSSREVFTEVLDKMLGKSKNERTADVSHTIYTIACKAAVKANKRLDEAEIKSILEQLSKLDNPYTCPHGRPAALVITKHEMEKMFKRIV